MRITYNNLTADARLMHMNVFEQVCKLLVSLLKRNKNPADDEGETPLDRAALGGHRQVVNFLKTKMYT